MQTNTELFLKKLSDSELLFDTKEAIRNEREAISIVVKYLKEIKARELYLKHACSSLFQFATEKLGYCAASAQARINAVELVIAVPEVEQKIESGELSLTAASKVQTFFRAGKKAKKSYSKKDKLEVLELCFDKPTREVERELAKRNPEVARFETTKPVGENRIELKFTITEELEAKIRKLKGLLAHSHSHMKTEELLEALVELGLNKFDPARKAERSLKRKEVKHKTSSDSANQRKSEGVSFRAHEVAIDTTKQVNVAEGSAHSPTQPLRAHETTVQNTAKVQVAEESPHLSGQARCAYETAAGNSKESQFAEVSPRSSTQPIRAHKMPTHSRYIPANARNQAWLNNQNRGCEFKSENGDRCGSKHALQIDHVKGFALGGNHEPENLRILCANHNRFVWKSKIGSVVREETMFYQVS